MESKPTEASNQNDAPEILQCNALCPKVAVDPPNESLFARFVRKLFRIRNILILSFACVLGGVGVWAFLGREPSFEGKRLSEWIWAMNGKEAGPEKEQARAVVRRLGANSVPLLLDWLRQEDRPSMIARFDDVRHQVFFWLVRHKFIANRSITSLRQFNPSHSAMAMWALPELDFTSRRAAIPSLIQMLGDPWPKPNEMSRVAGCACLVLSKMAPESIDPLIGALSGADGHTRLQAAAALGLIGPDARAAIPILEKELANKDPTIRAGIAIVIGKLGGDPDAFVPAIIGALPELDPADLSGILEDLLVYKEHAKAAVPVLQNILHKAESATNRSEAWVSGLVSNALQQIDPAAVRRAAP